MAVSYQFTIYHKAMQNLCTLQTPLLLIPAVVGRRFTLRVAPTCRFCDWFGAPHLPLGFLQHGITFFLHNKSGAKIANQQLQPLSGSFA
jgi:hypothetical protein